MDVICENFNKILKIICSFMADILHFQTDDYIFGEFCYHINTDTVHLQAELYFMSVSFFDTGALRPLRCD